MQVVPPLLGQNPVRWRHYFTGWSKIGHGSVSESRRPTDSAGDFASGRPFLVPRAPNSCRIDPVYLRRSDRERASWMGAVAVFVDGDNLPAVFAGRIIRAAQSLGSISVARVYGNESSLVQWADKPSFHFVFSGSGKNASDVLIAIEATEHVLLREVETVLLCSSDADFSHLARFIRARGIHVIGMGEEKTRPAMRWACSEFQVLVAEPPCAQSNPRLSDLDTKVVGLLAGAGRKGLPVTLLGGMMYQRHKTRITTRPEKTWRAYLSKHADLYDLDPRGPEAHVRLKSGVSR